MYICNIRRRLSQITTCDSSSAAGLSATAQHSQRCSNPGCPEIVYRALEGLCRKITVPNDVRCEQKPATPCPINPKPETLIKPNPQNHTISLFHPSKPTAPNKRYHLESEFNQFYRLLRKPKDRAVARCYNPGCTGERFRHRVSGYVGVEVQRLRLKGLGYRLRFGIIQSQCWSEPEPTMTRYPFECSSCQLKYP